MIVLQRFTVEEERCYYLPDRPNRLDYSLVWEITPEEYEHKMNEGYRKFGPFLFCPACNSCQECRPIRVLTDRFTPNRSQRRALKRNSDLTIRYAPPIVDAERLALYNRYHASQESRKGWPPTEKDASDYTLSFLQNSLPSVEISVWRDATLYAVALTELTPNTVSGIYHYHDPELSERSLGKFVMLHTIELARTLDKPYAYFGYYVRECGSLNYKSSFQPCEILGTDGVWRTFPDTDSAARDDSPEPFPA